MDTFITSKEVWCELKSLSQQIQDERNVVSRIKLRAARCEKFYAYMITQYEPLLEEATKRELDPTWLGNPLEEMLSELKADINNAISSAERNYGKKTNRTMQRLNR